jgi:hypothetical protein
MIRLVRVVVFLHFHVRFAEERNRTTGGRVAVPGLDDPRASKGSRSSSHSSISLDRFACRPPLTPDPCASASDPYESLTSSPRCLLSLRSNFTGSVSVRSGCSAFALVLLLAPTGGTIPLSSFALLFSLSFRLSFLLRRFLGAILSKSCVNRGSNGWMVNSAAIYIAYTL